MRFLSRLHGCAGAVILLVLYSFWHLHDSDRSIATAWRSKRVRLVVFGDDWSDTGDYRLSPPPKGSFAERDPGQGQIWVETLCEELGCDIRNFARSLPQNADTMTVGSVVDFNAFSQAAINIDRQILTAATDLKAQVDQYLAYNKKDNRYFSTRRRDDERTIFTVYYGLWDLLVYSMMTKDQATGAIDESIAGLFQELDLLAENAGAPIKVILPRMIDVTFLPCFQTRRVNADRPYAVDQHHMVFLLAYWNNLLVHTAIDWKNGQIFMPDSNTVIMEQVRAKQMHSTHSSNTSTLKQAPLFEFIKQPCIESNSAGDTPSLDGAAKKKCLDPSQHLFWDDLHLSGTAHQLIGLHAASLVLSNASVNTHPTPQDFAPPGRRPATGFNLRFPPGY